LATTDQKLQFVNQLNYDLPIGRGRRFVNRGGVLNYLIGEWTFLTIQSIRSGLPVSFTSAGSPYKYLPGEGWPQHCTGTNHQPPELLYRSQPFPTVGAEPVL
jgi:hypothetical protein